MTDERLQIWVGFAKFFLGTFAIGVATLLINSEIQDREIELKEMDQLGKFVSHALTEDVGVRLRFAQYFSSVTRSEGLKKGWTDYVAIVEREYKEKQTTIAELKTELKEPATSSVKRVEIETKINKIQAELEVPKASRREVISQLLRDDKFEEVLKIDPGNTIALMGMLKKHALNKEFEKAIAIFPKMKAANRSGVAFSDYPFAIYSYASIGQIDVAKSLFSELKREVLKDISNGYGYLSRADTIKWVQDKFRDVEWETQDPDLKPLLNSYIAEFGELARKARTAKKTN